MPDHFRRCAQKASLVFDTTKGMGVNPIPFEDD